MHLSPPADLLVLLLDFILSLVSWFRLSGERRDWSLSPIMTYGVQWWVSPSLPLSLSPLSPSLFLPFPPLFQSAISYITPNRLFACFYSYSWRVISFHVARKRHQSTMHSRYNQMNLIAAAAAHHDHFTNLAITINVKSQLTITRFVNNAFNSNFNCNVGVAVYLCYYGYKQRPSKKDKIMSLYYMSQNNWRVQQTISHINTMCCSSIILKLDDTYHSFF